MSRAPPQGRTFLNGGRDRTGGEARGLEKERNKKRAGKSGRMRFPSASRYQAEGGHMKLANVPTCPFPTYRVFPDTPVPECESGKWRDWGGTKGNPSRERQKRAEDRARGWHNLATRSPSFSSNFPNLIKTCPP